MAIGAYGKRSTLDREKDYRKEKSPYLAVKYHIKSSFPNDMISLHNFKDGYCGMSKVENETYNLCYLSHRDNLIKHVTIRSAKILSEIVIKNKKRTAFTRTKIEQQYTQSWNK